MRPERSEGGGREQWPLRSISLLPVALFSPTLVHGPSKGLQGLEPAGGDLHITYLPDYIDELITEQCFLALLSAPSTAFINKIT